MKKIICLIIFNVLFVRIANAEKFTSLFNKVLESFSASTVFIESIPPGSHATGCIISIENLETDKILLVTNKHVFKDIGKINITLMGMDSSRANIINKMVLPIDLRNEKGNLLYVTPSDSLTDIAAIWIDKPDDRILNKYVGNTFYYRTISSSQATKLNNLHIGMPIYYFGYPLGIKVNGFMPILRDGIISGVDSINNFILLDAQAFPGSSGSPVFLDPINTNPIIDGKYSPFIGIISEYIPYVKKLYNLQTKNVEMIQTENAGIAKVMSAQEIIALAEQARIYIDSINLESK